MSQGIAKSAYRYVPASAAVYFPLWAEEVSHDIPFADSISGSIDLKIEAETPLLVARGGDRADRQGRTADGSGGRGSNAPPKREFVEIGGRTAIPGSTIRGMLRNVVEIASFGKLGSWVVDRRLSYRDLQNEDDYIRHFTEQVDGGYRSRSRAAWLEVAPDGSWQLLPCEYARVKITDLEQYHEAKGRRPIDLRSRQSGSSKYERWGTRPEDLRVRFTPTEEMKQIDDGGLTFRAAHALGERGTTAGTLVFTGQASDLGRIPTAKKREFIFFDEGEAPSPIPISREKQREFEWIHSQGERHGEPTPNVEWAFFKKWLQAGRRVPVFYLDESPVDLAFGLAQLFRLPYAHSLHDAIRNTSHDHLDDRPDLAEVMFGRVGKDDGSAIKGRLSVEPFWFVPPSPGQSRPSTEKHLAILMGPRASFYPFTVLQPDASGGQVPRDRSRTPKPIYKTFVDDDVELAGWKRYPVHDPVPANGGIPPGSDAVVSELHPVKKGTAFTGRIHVHNLRPEELGALLWAMTWGDTSGKGPHRHSLGMGKPLGFGRIKVSIVGHDLGDVLGARLTSADLERLRVAYVDAMEKALDGKWFRSEQIFQLLSMAVPAPDASRLVHPMLGRGRANNEFVAIKSQGAVLEPLDRSPYPRATPADRRRLRERQAEKQRQNEEQARLAAEARAAAEAEEKRQSLSPADRFLQESCEFDAGKAWERFREEAEACRSADQRRELHAALLRHPALGEQVAKWHGDEATTPKAGSAEYQALPEKRQQRADKLHRNIDFLRRLSRGEEA